MAGFEMFFTLGLIGLAGLMGLMYLLRVIIKGRAHFARVDRQGASALLSKEMMEAFYWFLQPLGRLLVCCRITANGISWGSLGFAILAGCCLAFGHFGFGAAFATISAMMDSLDGLVARISGTASDAGEVLDAAVDRYAEFLFLGGLVVYYREIPVLMILSLLALLGSYMVSYSSAKAEALRVDVPKGSMRRPERALYLILGAALSPVTIPWLEATRELPIPIGHPMVAALCLVAVLANVSAIERLWAIAKEVRARELVARHEAALKAAANESHGDDPAVAESGTALVRH